MIKLITEDASLDSIVTVGVYGDEVPGMDSVDQVVAHFTKNDIDVFDVSGDMDYGWEMTLKGNPRDIYKAVNKVIPGYNCSSAQEFIDKYQIDESCNESSVEDYLEEDSDMTDLAPGTLVDFGAYGQLYIVSDVDEDTWWVSDEPDSEMGWSIKKYLANKVISTPDDEDDLLTEDNSLINVEDTEWKLHAGSRIITSAGPIEVLDVFLENHYGIIDDFYEIKFPKGQVDVVSRKNLLEIIRDNALELEECLTDSLITESDNEEPKTKILTLEVCDVEGTIEDLLNYVKDLASTGHSFDVGVDAETDERHKKFFIDGDGTDRIYSISSVAKAAEESSTLSEVYWIDNDDVMNKVKDLSSDLERDDWNFYNDQYTGKAYYCIFTKKGDNGAIAKAIMYNHHIEPQIIDITVDQAIGRDSLDSNDALRKQLGRMLMPHNESSAENYLEGKIKVGSKVSHVDDSPKTAGTVVSINKHKGIAKICVGDPANKDYVDVSLDKLELLEESLREALEKGDSITIWWRDPNWDKTAPCYAACTYIGKTKDGKYKCKSDTYGHVFLVDVESKTVTTPEGKEFDLDNESGWMKIFDTVDTITESVSKKDYDEFCSYDIAVIKAVTSLGGDVDDYKGSLTHPYDDEDRMLIVFYSTVEKKNSKKFSRGIEKALTNVFSNTRFSRIREIDCYKLSRDQVAHYISYRAVDSYMEKFDLYEITIKVSSDLTEGITEADYGGAYDIDPTQYFTKDDIVRFGEKVCDHLNEIYYDVYDISDISIDNNILKIRVINSDEFEFDTSLKIDMRKIRKPSDLEKEVLTVVADLCKQIDELSASK